MPSQVTNYQCPNCTGPLHYSSEAGKLVCEYCESSFDIAEIEALYAKKEEKAAEAFETEHSEQASEGSVIENGAQSADPFNWDSSNIEDNWGEDAQNMHTYNCPSCGAEIICELTTAATKCPYCGNPSIVPGQFSNDLKPDYIIPFKLDKNAAVEALKRHCSKKLFLPKPFTDKNHIMEIQGIYVPFWLFNAEVSADYRFDCTISKSYRRGDYRITDTSHYDVDRAGTVQFNMIPTDASRKMDDSYMDSIEPYDYSELKPFSTAYLPGYYADKYDVSIKEDTERVNLRCENTTESIFKSDITGYQTVSKISGNINVNNGIVNYALLPVWILNTKWQDKDFMFTMNGQTGKIVGDLPISRSRFWGFCGILTAIFALLLMMTSFGRSLCNIAYSFVGAFLPVIIFIAVFALLIILITKAAKKKKANARR